MMELSGTFTTIVLLLVLMYFATRQLIKLAGEVGDLNFASFINIFVQYHKVDFVSFMKRHRDALEEGKKAGDYVMGVCNYYTLMADLITMTSGPFWHFVPMYRHLTRKECHHKFHHTLTEYLEAKQGDKILELGCGFGEIGRQVAQISGASVTGLTMAEVEIVEGNDRIKAAGLQNQCKMVQGNYHKMAFESGSFDKVFGVYTLKYSSDIDAAIAEAVRVLKPGGKFVSYEILVTDKYDASNKLQRYYVDNISTSTCMPPLWHAQDFRSAAKKAGLVLAEEDDLCGPSGTLPWYNCLERKGVHAILSSSSINRLIKLAEYCRLLPPSFSDWFENCIVHPATDFVHAGKLGVVTGSVMMTWRKA